MINRTIPEFPLPPRGWPLVLLLATFIVIGLIGHDPWKNDDAITIGITVDMLQRGHWLVTYLADHPYPDAPLFYWTAAVTGALLSWLLPLHDAIRIASGFWVALIFFLLYRASREWHAEEEAPHEFAIASVLAIAGCLGFLIHSHEAQPMLVALAGHAAAYWALALMRRKPKAAILISGLGLGLGFLGNGLPAMLTLLPLAIIALALSDQRKKTALILFFGILVGIAVSAPWLILTATLHPRQFNLWLNLELSQFGKPNTALYTAGSYLKMLLWFAWPALPLALWTLRSKRKFLREPRYLVPLLGLPAALLALSITFEARSSSALLLLPPLALLAAPGVATLRRGANNAFDWFGIMCFSFFCLLTWVGWSAMVLGWPERLAARAMKLAPGFGGEFRPFAFAFAILVSLTWIWLMTTGHKQRSPWRGLVHWLTGLTALWALLMSLWLPWIEYGRSYRSIGTTLKSALPTDYNCVIGRNINDANRALVDYWGNVPLVADKSAHSASCDWLFVYHDANSKLNINLDVWGLVSEMRRPSQRSERFVLYRRKS